MNETTVAQPVTDIHAHFFNVLHLPLEGILVARTGMSSSAAAELADILKRAAIFGGSLFEPARSARIRSDAIEAVTNDLPMPPGNDDMEWSVTGTSPIAVEVEPEAISGVVDDAYHLLQIPRAALKWLFQMTLPSSQQIRYYRSHIVGATLVVSHLMDMDGFYPGHSYLNVSQRHQDLKELVKGNSGVLGFGAYNPHHDDAIAILQELHKDLGGRMGVKFYPPAGYRPIGNDETCVPPTLDPVRVDAKNLELMEWCADTGVPVFSHCTTRGFATRDKWGENAAPKYWRDLFEAHPGLTGLHLCLAHAGGADQWIRGRLDELAHATLSLAEDYPNVYFEFGHFEEIVWNETHLRKFSRSLAEARTDYPKAISKAMFGTDWHVSNAIVLESGDVHGHFASALAEAGGFDSERFFSQAAAEYLAPIL